MVAPRQARGFSRMAPQDGAGAMPGEAPTPGAAAADASGRGMQAPVFGMIFSALCLQEGVKTGPSSRAVRQKPVAGTATKSDL